jgi:hypothetical protein
MDQQEMERIMKEAATEVVETMFFTSIVTEDEAPDAPDGNGAVAVKVRFRGNPCGSFRMRLYAEPARQMAAVFLGDDGGGVSAEQLGGVMGELTNMIAGTALSKFDPKAKFCLESPVLLGGLETPRGTRTASRSLPLECGWLHLDLWVERESSDGQ